MPSARSHQLAGGFTVINMRRQQEIQNDILARITSIEVLKQPAKGLVESLHFDLDVQQVDATTFKVDVHFRDHKRGSTVAQIHLAQSATELQEAFKALMAGMDDGWVWQVT